MVNKMPDDAEYSKSDKNIGNKDDLWVLKLYVAGKTKNCEAALENLRRICEQELNGQYQIEVIDLIENPELAEGDQIIAIPTLIRKLPVPVKKIVGSLRDTDRVIVGLDLRRQK